MDSLITAFPFSKNTPAVIMSHLYFLCRQKLVTILSLNIWVFVTGEKKQRRREVVGVGALQEINNGEGNVHFLEQMINKRFVCFKNTVFSSLSAGCFCLNPNNLKVIRKKKAAVDKTRSTDLLVHNFTERQKHTYAFLSSDL